MGLNTGHLDAKVGQVAMLNACIGHLQIEPLGYGGEFAIIQADSQDSCSSSVLFAGSKVCYGRDSAGPKIGRTYYQYRRASRRRFLQNMSTT